MVRIFLCSLLLMTSTAHAAWLHLCPASQGFAGMPEALLTRPDGTAARLIVNEQAGIPGCHSLPLPADVRQIEAVYPLPRQSAPGDTILLQGALKQGRFAVGGVTLPATRPGPALPGPMPLRANLLTAMRVRDFGVEERVHSRIRDGQLHLECGAGSRPAGVILTGPWYMPRADALLQASFSGAGTFEWLAADTQHAATESGTGMGRIVARSRAQTARMDLPRDLRRAGWRRFVIVCPREQASLRLDSLQLEPDASRAAPRATWVWNARDWQQHPASLLDWAHGQGVGDLFITVPVENGAVRDAAALAGFVRQASAHGIGVWTADGDPRMVLPAERAATIRRARAYAAYNAQADAAQRLRGIQFDIEPYLLPGYEMAAAEWDRRYLELARALRKVAKAMQLEFVMPYWWADKPGLLHALAPLTDGLAIMDYRTDPQEIYRFAVPFLDWAAAYGKRVRIALEAGPVAPETQRRYTRAGKGAAGELLVVRLEGCLVLVLLKEASAHPDAEAFRLAGSMLFDGSATSFHADKPALERLLPRLERELGAWSGFGGIALHEFR